VGRLHLAGSGRLSLWSERASLGHSSSGPRDSGPVCGADAIGLRLRQLLARARAANVYELTGRARRPGKRGNHDAMGFSPWSVTLGTSAEFIRRAPGAD